MKIEDIKTIAIIGSGDMGHGIGEIAAMAGYKVKLYDIKQEFIDTGHGQGQRQLCQAGLQAEDDPGSHG